MHQSSGGSVQRLFCHDCGTQIAYRADIWPDETHFYMANLDNPEAVKPEAHFHWGERLSWMTLEDSLPKYQASADDADPI